MSARDNMYDPSGSTKRNIDGIKDGAEKPRHYYAFKESFNVPDFQGRYHVNTIAHKFPIPGTALKKERERMRFNAVRPKIMDKKVSEIGKSHEKKAKVKERHKRLENNLVFQAKVGDMLRRVALTIEQANDVVEGKTEMKRVVEKKPKER